MTLSRREVEVLSAKLLNGTITPAEQVQLNQWLDEQMAKETYEVDTGFASDAEQLRLRMLTKILKATTPPHRQKVIRRTLISGSYVAVALAMVLALSWLFIQRSNDDRLEHAGVESIMPESVFAGGDNATLTLADGKTISLSPDQQGIMIADQRIIYRDGSTSVTGLKKSARSVPPETLTVTTPAGLIYRVTLPDGSDVWMNARSRLTYPSEFSGGERVVNVVGEAYFSVKKQANKPFKVRSKGQEIEVLGTEFNVAVYPDDPQVKTTLMEGAVRIFNSAANDVALLSPGQQSITHGKETRIGEVDTEHYTAWKDGFFYFDGLPAYTAFAQLGRWYDIDVVYAGKVPTVSFFGMIERNRPLSFILKILGKSGIRFGVRQVGDRKQLVVINE